MLNDPTPAPKEALKVIDYDDPKVEARMGAGKMNVNEAHVLRNVEHSIRLGYPQLAAGPLRPEEICLVGSGPSLNETEGELREILWRGNSSLVTMNGAYHWCLERNLKPNTQIVMDARDVNARFLNPEVPKCNYAIASQCAPETWAAVRGRDHVWIFHCVLRVEGSPVVAALDRFYEEQWVSVGGGTTVATRAIGLLRMMGYTRFHLFGVDCCWDASGTEHHALPQPENARDRPQEATVQLRGDDGEREFVVSPWMLKQYEDFLQLLKINGAHFQLHVHGDGMLAYTLQTGANLAGVKE